MKKSIIFFILLFSVNFIKAENYWHIDFHLGSSVSSFTFTANDVMLPEHWFPVFICQQI